jgi:DNA ligase-1
MKFRPMLAAKCSDVNIVKYPILASKKLDGVRCLVQDVLVSRTLKAIPNVHVQKKFAGMPEGIDGELIVGDPREPDAYRKTVSVVMSEDKPADDVKFYFFDRYSAFLPFEKRLYDAHAAMGRKRDHPGVEIVQHVRIKNAADLTQLEEMWLAEGYEGVMLRSPEGPYKEGRSSEREGYLLKLKRFEDAEAEIIGFVEEQENTNAAMQNALGHTERSTAKAGMVGKDRLGKFEVIGVGGTYDGQEFSVGGGFTAEMRKEFWADRKNLLFKKLKYKYFAGGSKERPRFPVFLGWRDERDI